MERTPPHLRLARRPAPGRPLDTDPPANALLQLTPLGRAAVDLMRAWETDFRPPAEWFDDELEGEDKT